MYLGDFSTNASVYKRFVTVTSTGAPSALSGAGLKVYQDVSSIASSASTAYTITADNPFTGANFFTIATTLDTTYFVAGHDYSVFVSSGTVNTQSIAGYLVAEFSIKNRSALNPTVGGRTLNVSASGIGDANVAQVIGSTISTSVAQLAVQTIGSSMFAANSSATQVSSSGVLTANLTSLYEPAKTAAQAGDAMTLSAAYDAAKVAATTGSAMTLSAAYDAAKTAATTGSAMTLTSAYDAAKVAATTGSAMILSAAYDAAKVAATTGSLMGITTNYGAAGRLLSDIKYVNGTSVTGNGSTATPWGP